MDVLIRLERLEPPRGTVESHPRGSRSEAEVLPFVGWLGLLRVLAEIVRSAGEPAGG